MLSKPSRLALSGIAIACGAFLGACNDSPRLQFLTVAPKNGEIYVSAKPAAGVKGAAVHHARPAQQAPRTTGRHLAALPSPVTATCGSLVIALALHEGRLDAEAAFDASQLDETFQIEAWGEDAEATRRRAALAEDIRATARFLELLRER